MPKLALTPTAWTFTAALVSGFAVGAPAWADPPQDPHGILTVQVENDAVSTFKGTSDQYYTSGLRLGYVTGTVGLPDAVTQIGRAVWGDGVQRVSFDLTQSIFTPRNTQLRVPDPTDRPYAGYLAGSVMLLHDTDLARSTLGMSVGVIGPGAGAREIQNGFHNLIGDTPNRGWSYQLKNEPAFEFLAEKTLRVPIAQVGGLEMDTLPAVTAGVGIVRDYAQVSTQVRIGQGLASDFGAPRIRPGMSGGDAYTPTRAFAWYFFAGADGQVVAHDEFLDGSTFRDGTRRVKREWGLAELEAGAAMMLYGVRVTYTQTWQTQSFRGQRSGLFNFGSLAASVRF